MILMSLIFVKHFELPCVEKCCIYKLAYRRDVRVSNLSPSSPQFELPVTSPPQSQDTGPDGSPIDTKLVKVLGSVVGPQTPTDWLKPPESTRTPISPPDPPLTDSSLTGTHTIITIIIIHDTYTAPF